MRKIKPLFFLFFLFKISFAQISDTTIGNTYYNLSDKFIKINVLDSAIFYLEKAQTIYINHYGEKSLKNAKCINQKGVICKYSDEYDKALDYFNQSLDIRRKILNEKNIDVAKSYNNIGSVYRLKSEYDLALKNYFKSLEISKELVGEKNADVARTYNIIGLVYDDKFEYDKALEYIFKAIDIRKELYGEKNDGVAAYYNNLGIVYFNKMIFDKSLEYYFKSLNISIELMGENNNQVVSLYSNMGNVYQKRLEYDKALEYYFKALNILKEHFDENKTGMAILYNSIGSIYYKKLEFNKALDHYLKSLYIFKEYFGEKHTYVALLYYNIGVIYQNKFENSKALEYFHKGFVSCLRYYNDTTNVRLLPQIKDYIDWNWLIKNLQSKAEILAIDSFKNNIEIYKDLKLALEYYQSCDTIIEKVRKNMDSKSDKIALGEITTNVYENAIGVCFKLSNTKDLKENMSQFYRKMAFYFSEQNKSVVLLEAISSQEGLKFAGIPDSLLQKENNFKVNINFYEKKLAEGADSVNEVIFRNKLFDFNRQYEEFTKSLETNYPNYFNLKYSIKQPELKNIQKILDNKTAIRSYFVGDSTIFIFTITNKNIDIQQIAKINNFEDTIQYFRKGLVYQSERMKENYRRIGYFIFKQLFPNYTYLNNIENLIIIPDGILGVIPFEALLTKLPDNNNVDDLKNYENYPFLIKKFNISYSYSANLFYRTFPKQNNSKPEITSLNDWLALAPVFDDKNNKGVKLASRELQRQLTVLQQDSVVTRRFLLNGAYVAPLPGTESEIKAIFDEYEKNNKKAQVLLNQNANEQYIKSGTLNDYKTIHFATHGFVNSEKPELSGILLSQDTTDKEDGFLYSGEIYNLNLNADLVVLSACETGLGQIKKGEGIIGLTRALLYAGAKNIVVSLWQVSDASTSELMINFYKSILSKKYAGFSVPLRQAKLKMISDSKFAHPFYWSPFILIGK